MDAKKVLAALGRMFPSVNLNEAIQKADQAISGTENSLNGVTAAAHSLGLNSQMVQEIYTKYGNTMQGRMVCQLLGTTPEALKADADRIVGGSASGRFAPSAPASSPASTKFPRLK